MKAAVLQRRRFKCQPFEHDVQGHLRSLNFSKRASLEEMRPWAIIIPFSISKNQDDSMAKGALLMENFTSTECVR